VNAANKLGEESAKFPPLLPNREPVHATSSDLRVVAAVEADEPKAPRPPGLMVDHDARRCDGAKSNEEVVQVQIRHVVWNVKHEEVRLLSDERAELFD
jgi:hypothetical protein